MVEVDRHETGTRELGAGASMRCVSRPSRLSAECEKVRKDNVYIKILGLIENFARRRRRKVRVAIMGRC